MELYDVMRTTFAAREFTADPQIDDEMEDRLVAAKMRVSPLP